MNINKWKNELAYLWMDYKWFLLAGLIAATAAVYFLTAALTQKESALSVILIDCHASVRQESMVSDYMKASDLDPKRQQAEILTNLMFSDSDSGTYAMTSLSCFLTGIGTGKLDVVGMKEADFQKYAGSGTWKDLAEVLEREKMSDLSDSLLIKDGKIIGIYADGLPRLRSYGCYENPDGRGVLGVIYNSAHKEEAKRYLEYLSSTSDVE